jgi:hypothetical protein
MIYHKANAAFVDLMDLLRLLGIKVARNQWYWHDNYIVHAYVARVKR